MAVNDTYIDLSPKRLWSLVLARPETYDRWVVGAADIRDADPNWPAVGSTFQHTVGFGPLRLKDHTEVVAAEPAQRLSVRAKTRPFGEAQVVLELKAEGYGTRVTMSEQPVEGVMARLYNGAMDLALRGRNEETLRRLKDVAEHS
ncbi:MAG: SRPBCC family protein [Thermoleophilaceae bacterium]|nr:SRPBCC family protein [Thermoleophilaceae bacterium]